MSTTYAGTHYDTITLAALAFAASALPDLSVIGSTEEPRAVAQDLEAYCHSEAAQSGTVETPDGVTYAYWRALCRGAIAARIVAHREGRRVCGADVEVQP